MNYDPIPKEWTYEDIVEARRDLDRFQKSRGGKLFDDLLAGKTDLLESLLERLETWNDRHIAEFNSARAVHRFTVELRADLMGFKRPLDEAEAKKGPSNAER